MKFIYCPYCKELTKNFNYNYCCKNHKDVKIHFYSISNSKGNSIDWMWLFYKDYAIRIMESKMMICIDNNIGGHNVIMEITEDPTLTPENLPNKLKTYLNFY